MGPLTTNSASLFDSGEAANSSGKPRDATNDRASDVPQRLGGRSPSSRKVSANLCKTRGPRRASASAATWRGEASSGSAFRPPSPIASKRAAVLPPTARTKRSSRSAPAVTFALLSSTRESPIRRKACFAGTESHPAFSTSWSIVSSRAIRGKESSCLMSWQRTPFHMTQGTLPV